MQISKEILKEWREEGKRSLFFLARAILGFKDLDENIHLPLCLALEDYENTTRLLVIFPRTWFKSTICSISYPIWRSLSNPNVRILIVQNSFSNACKKLGAIKELFEKNRLFRALYPDILPPKNSTWTKECLKVNRTAAHPEGTFEAAGVGTAATSRHYDDIIQDDTISPKKDDMSGIVQQPTQADIEKAIGWHKHCHPMLLDPLKSRIVIVGTRWADNDLLGYVMRTCPEYRILSRAIFENDKGEPASLENGGHIVWNRFNEKAAELIARQEGPYMFACLYLNMPTAAINQVFQRRWIRYYATSRPDDCVFCTSVDLASAKKEESSEPDYTVILTCGVSPSEGKIYVTNYVRARLDPGQTVEAVFDHVRAYHPLEVIVESIGYQRTLNYWIRKRMHQTGMMFYINELKGLSGSKVERIRGLQPYFSEEKIIIRPHMAELEQELLAFPKGMHDDIIDAMSMQIRFWYEITESYRQEKKKDVPFGVISADTVLAELEARAMNVRTYPYDVGQLAERYRGQKRDYSIW